MWHLAARLLFHASRSAHNFWLLDLADAQRWGSAATMATRSGGMGVGWSNVLGGTWVGSTATVSDGTGAGDDSPVRSARLADGDNEAEAFAQLQRLNGVSCRAGNNLDGGVACHRHLTNGQASCGSGCQRTHRGSGNCATASDGDLEDGTLLLDSCSMLPEALTTFGPLILLTPNDEAQPRRTRSEATRPTSAGADC